MVPATAPNSSPPPSWITCPPCLPSHTAVFWHSCGSRKQVRNVQSHRRKLSHLDPRLSISETLQGRDHERPGPAAAAAAAAPGAEAALVVALLRPHARTDAAVAVAGAAAALGRATLSHSRAPVAVASPLLPHARTPEVFASPLLPHAEQRYQLSSGW